MSHGGSGLLLLSSLTFANRPLHFEPNRGQTGAPVKFQALAGGYSFTGAAGGTAVAVDASGNAYVTGATSATNFPTTPGAFQTTFNGGTCQLGTRYCVTQYGPCKTVFVYKLSSDGSTLIYSTYLGTGVANAIAIDSAGNAYVTGGYNGQISSGGSFPVTPGLPKGGQSGAFVTKLNAQGNAVVYSAILGDQASGTGIAVDAGGNAHVAGVTGAGSFPTTPGAFQTAFPKSSGGFILKVNSTGSALVYSTLLGGAGANPDTINALAVDAAGETYVTGGAGSADFPVTPGAYQPVAKGQNAFLAKLSADGTSLRYSTFLGGSGTDTGTGSVVNSQGEVYVTGTTNSPDFPVTATFGPAVTQNQPGSFLTLLSAAGDTLEFSDVIGGPAAAAIAIDNQGAAYVVGSGIGTGVPVTSNAEMRCSGAMLLMKFSADGKTLLYSSFFGNQQDNGPGLGLALDSETNVYVADSMTLWKVSSPQTASLITPPCFDGWFWDINHLTPLGIAPGEVVLISGSRLGPQAEMNAGLDSSGRFPTTLDGTQVLVGGFPAPLLNVQDTKIRFMAPFEIAGQQQAQVEVVRAGENSDPHTASVSPALPSIIELLPVSVGCQSAVLNQDLSINSSTNPAAAGSIIAVYAEGAGQLNMPVVDGSIVTPPLPAPLLPVDVWFQNVHNLGTIFYAGSAPGLVAGTLQINVRIPTNVTPGAVMFGIDIGGAEDHSLACLNVK